MCVPLLRRRLLRTPRLPEPLQPLHLPRQLRRHRLRPRLPLRQHGHLLRQLHRAVPLLVARLRGALLQQVERLGRLAQQRLQLRDVVVLALAGAPELLDGRLPLLQLRADLLQVLRQPPEGVLRALQLRLRAGALPPRLLHFALELAPQHLRGALRTLHRLEALLRLRGPRGARLLELLRTLLKLRHTLRLRLDDVVVALAHLVGGLCVCLGERRVFFFVYFCLCKIWVC